MTMSPEELEQLQRERAAPVEVLGDYAYGLAQRVVRHQWHLVSTAADGEAWHGKVRGQPVVVIWSMAREKDDHLWLHVSVSHPSRIPTWEEMSEVKRLFVGDHRWAVQVHPPKVEHVNLHERVLHLFSPHDTAAWPLPDFTWGTGSI